MFSLEACFVVFTAADGLFFAWMVRFSRGLEMPTLCFAGAPPVSAACPIWAIPRKIAGFGLAVADVSVVSTRTAVVFL